MTPEQQKALTVCVDCGVELSEQELERVRAGLRELVRIGFRATAGSIAVRCAGCEEALHARAKVVLVDGGSPMPAGLGLFDTPSRKRWWWPVCEHCGAFSLFRKRYVCAQGCAHMMCRGCFRALRAARA